MTSQRPAPDLNPERLEIRKYPNRRYYDTTTSRHLCLQEIHKLIVEGHNVRIVDAQSEQDITAKILTQILLDYEPLKLEVFSNELLTQAIRVNDSLLRDFVDLYFRQAFEAFCSSRRRFQSMLREAHQLTTTLARPETWISGFFPGWGGAASTSSVGAEESSSGNAQEGAALKADIEQLRQEISELKSKLAPKPKRTTRRPKARNTTRNAHKTRNSPSASP